MSISGLEYSLEYSDDNGSNWTLVDEAYDAFGMFETYEGGYVFAPPNDKVTYKRLVAAASNKFWYEVI
jgi:hypothetical protein